MTSKALCFWVRFAIIMIAVCGIGICAIWYPASFSLIDVGFITANLSGLTPIQIWPQLILLWAAALPCFFVLYLVWQISTAVKNEEFFTFKSAKIIKLIAHILFINLAVFLTGNIIFLILKINDFAFFNFIIIICALVLAIFVSVFSHYVAKAADLKEINEGTV